MKKNNVYLLPPLLLCCFLTFYCKSPPRETIYTYYNGDSNLTPLHSKKDAIHNRIAALTGVTLETQHIQGNDEEAEARVLIAIDNYPDLIYGHNATDVFLEAQALIPLNELIDKYGPNLKKYYGNNLNKFKKDDGNIYYIGNNLRQDEVLYGDSGFWLPIDLLREADWPQVKTFDQYINLIREYAKRHPTFNEKPVIGFTAITDSWKIYTLTHASSFLMGNPNDGAVYIDRKTLEAKLILSADFAKRYYKILNELWLDGLVDRDLFTQTYEGYLEKIASGRVIGFYDEKWQIDQARNSLISQNLLGRVHMPFPVLFAGVNHESYNRVIEVTSAYGVGISRDCQDPEGAMQYLNRLLDDDIQKLIHWGIKGVNYSVEDGRMVMSVEQLKRPRNTYFVYGFPQRAYNQKFADGNPLEPVFLPEYINSKYTAFEREVVNAYGLNSWRDMFTPPLESPYGLGWDVSIAPDHPAEKAKFLFADATRRHLALIIMAEKGGFDQAWENFQQELAQIDLKTYCDVRTEIYRKRAARWRTK